MGNIFQRTGELVAAISTVSSGVSLLTSAVELATYILFGFACLQMAKKVGVPYGWRGFIPFADRWLLGRLTDVGKLHGNTHWQLLVLYIGETFFGCLYRAFAGASRVAWLAESFLDVTVPTALESGLGFAIWFRLLGYACGIGYTVLLCMGYHRLAKNFGGASYIGYFVLLMVGTLVNPLISAIALLLLSRKDPTVTAPRTDDVFGA